MLTKKCCLVCLAIALTASSTYTFAQNTTQSRQLPVSLLRSKMKPINDHSNAALSKFGITKSTKLPADRTTPNAASSGIPGIDSLVNWSDSFVYAGFDGNGNPQMVWPYAMVGNPPESGPATSLRAPIVPVTVDLLDASGNVVISFGPDGNVLMPLWHLASSRRICTRTEWVSLMTS